MLVAIVSDIHANLEAFKAVLKEIDALGAQEIYCLGDIVGYGPHPHECIGLVQARCRAVVRGNHDSGAGGRLPFEKFNREGAEALAMTRRVTHPLYLHYLRHLPYRYVIDDITLVHASPDVPRKFRYVVDEKRVGEAFKSFSTSVCFVGHTHIPFLFEDPSETNRTPIDKEVAFRLAASTVDLIPAMETELPEEPETPAETLPVEPPIVLPKHRRLIMVGSVGQPRDGNPRAAFGLFDTSSGEYSHRRVTYDIKKTADAIFKAGLPQSLAKRLFRGM